MLDKLKEHIKKRFEEDACLRYLKENKYVIFFIILGILFYTIIHELMHYYIANYLMYAAEICWTCFPISVKYLIPLSSVLKSHYFMIVMAPYLLNIFLLGLLFVLILITKKREIAILSIIPFFDTLANILVIPLCYFTGKSNDFLNLMVKGFFWEAIIIILTPLILFCIICLNYNRNKK